MHHRVLPAERNVSDLLHKHAARVKDVAARSLALDGAPHELHHHAPESTSRGASLPDHATVPRIQPQEKIQLASLHLVCDTSNEAGGEHLRRAHPEPYDLAVKRHLGHH